MHLKSLPGKVTQLRGARLSLWGPFLMGWLRRKRNGVVPCIARGSNRLLWVSSKDFYESYWFFCESEQGRREVGFFLRQLRNDEVFYDIGAFRGAYSAFAMLQASRQISVHSFEPLASNVECLLRIVKINRFCNIKTNAVAVGNSKSVTGGVNELEGMLRLGDEQASSQGNEFPSVSLDDYIATNPPPTVMKIDVDGFEVLVLHGGRRSLEKYHPRLWLEVHPTYLKQQGRSEDEVLQFLREIGYSISIFEDYRSGRPEISYHIWCSGR